MDLRLEAPLQHIEALELNWRALQDIVVPFEYTTQMQY